MDKFPNVALQAKDAGHTQSQCGRLFAPAYLSMPSLHFDDTGKTIELIFRYKFHAGEVVRGGTRNCFFDLFAPACIGAQKGCPKLHPHHLEKELSAGPDDP